MARLGAYILIMRPYGRVLRVLDHRKGTTGQDPGNQAPAQAHGSRDRGPRARGLRVWLDRPSGRLREAFRDRHRNINKINDLG